VEVLEGFEKATFNQSQFFLKKAGPNPSGLGLELSFIERMLARISSREKGRMREAASKESRDVEATRERFLKGYRKMNEELTPLRDGRRPIPPHMYQGL
jgi:hypothetical protein